MSSCCCLNICCLLPSNSAYFSSKRVPNEKALKSDLFSSTKNWMKQISDDTYVSNINMPGTHETMALYSYFTLSVPICQKWVLQDQLNSGIRFIDIRVKLDKKGQLPIYHAQSNQHALLEENVIDICDKFLLENPSEFIIMMIRIESSDSGAPTLSTQFEKITKKKRSNLFFYESKIPKLEDLRGKIWVWNGYNWSYKGFSMIAQQKTGILIRQDQYDCKIKEKKQFIKNMCDLAIKSKANRELGTEIYINQVNGQRWYDWPSSYAAEINKYVYEEEHYEGIVVFDFPGEEMLKQIIETNFTLAVKKPSSVGIQSSINGDTDYMTRQIAT